MEHPAPVQLRYRGITHQIAAGGTVAEALEQAGLAPDEMLAVRDGTLLAADAQLHPGDVLLVVDQILGGN